MTMRDYWKAIESGQLHGQEGHLNVCVLDQNSPATGFGDHARVVAFCPKGNALYCRVDLMHGLPEPTPEQVLKAARLDNDLRGKWKLSKVDPYETNGVGRLDFHFERVGQ